MADEQMRPASKEQAPDPARSYGRDKPEAEAGMGKLHNDAHGTPVNQPERAGDAVSNQRQPKELEREQDQPDHSMFEEEPLGWDQAPQDIDDPQKKRHPRQEGRGGTP